MNTTLKGHLAVIEVERRATEKGFVVSRPSIEARYDLIVDDGDSLHRVQVKFTNQNGDGNSLEVGLRKFGGNKGVGIRTSDVKTYTSKEVDVLAIFSPLTNKVYWLPISIFEKKTMIRLRLKQARNNQKKRVLLACDFEW